MSRFPLLFLCMLFFAKPLLHAQEGGEEVWRDLVELWMEQYDEDVLPDDLVETLQELAEHPINLNDTLSDALSELPFVTAFQREAIRAYIAQNGEMVSLAELHLLNGFDSLSLRMLLPFVTVKPVARDNSVSLVRMLRGGHSNLRLGGKTVFPLSRGYREDIYAGDPYRLYFRYQFKYSDRISFALSAEKDAGEALPFDFYGYHLMLNDFGKFKRIIVGKYHLQFGQGLALWSGFAPWKFDMQPLYRYGQGIRPASAFCEYGYMQGAATTLSLLPDHLSKKLELTLFYSYSDRDATCVSDTLSDEGTVFQSITQSGYHRTANEMAKKNMLGEHSFGGHLSLRSREWQLGTTAYGTCLAAPVVPADYVYNCFAFSGDRNFNAGIDFSRRYRRLLLFGEAAVANNLEVRRLRDETGWLPLAAVAGAQFSIDADNMLSVAYRYASPIYQNLHATMIGMSGKPVNEEGFLLFLRMRLPWEVDMQGSVDIFRYPWMRYRVYAPSTGSDIFLRLRREVKHNTMLDFQYCWRSTQRNSDIREYALEDICRRQMRLSLEYRPSEAWKLLSRVAFTSFYCDDHSSEEGMMLMQEVEWHTSLCSQPLSLAVRLSFFDVSDYDARIYSYESDMVYEFSVPMMTGRGMRCYLVCRHNFSEQLSAAFKYAVAYYPENEEIGSGYDLIIGNVKHECKFQMGLRF